jgi:hypothetical protein
VDACRVTSNFGVLGVTGVPSITCFFNEEIGVEVGVAQLESYHVFGLRFREEDRTQSDAFSLTFKDSGVARS